MNEKYYIVIADGNAWCAHSSDFVNLQESLAVFAATPVEALTLFVSAEKLAEKNKQNETPSTNHQQIE